MLPAGPSGFGVFARQDMPALSFVAEYVGERVTDAEANARGQADGGDEYLYNIDAFLVNATGRRRPEAAAQELFVLDARLQGNVARFINHSCEPNCVVFSVFFDHLCPQLARIAIFTDREIRAGEQLTYNCARAL